MKRFMLLAVLMLSAGCQSVPRGDELVWREDAVGPECSLTQTSPPSDLNPSALRIVTHALPDDPQCDRAIARALITRRDNKPLCTLGQLTEPGAVLRCRFYRDPATTKEVPDFTLPYLFLLIEHADGSTSRLLWESPYNGYSPYKKTAMPPNGEWIMLDLIQGIYWPQTDALNFNMNDGFQTLAKYATGFRATRKVDGKQSQPYSPGSPVIAIGVGSGSGIPGHFVAYVDDIELSAPSGVRYLITFPGDSNITPKP